MKPIYMIISALAVCGCVMENSVESIPAEEEMVTIRLSTGSAPEIFRDLSTKTVLTDDFNVEWHNGDEIALFVDKEPYKLTNVNSDGPEAVFEGEVPESWLNSDFRTVLYPYSAIRHNSPKGPIADRDGIGLSRVVIPSVQPLVSGTFARDYNYSAAGFRLSEDKPLYFKNLGGLISVTLTGNVTVTSIDITAPGNINGPAYYEMSIYASAPGFSEKGFHSENYWGGNAPPSKTVTLISEEGIALTETPQSFYAFVMPVKSVGDYTVTVETKEGKTFTETVTKNFYMFDDQILKLGSFDMICTFADMDGRTVGLDPAGRDTREFLLLSEPAPTVDGLPDWMDWRIEGGHIVFNPGINFSGESRSADVTITQGDISSTITFVQTSVSAFEPASAEFKWEAGAMDMMKTEYLPEDYTVDCSAYGEWMDAQVTQDGVRISVTENTAGVPREGKVDIVVEGTAVTCIPVRQMNRYEYESLIGEYEIGYRGQSNSGAVKVMTGTFTISAKEEGTSYEAVFNSKYDINSGKGFSYPIELLYNASDGNPLSLACPQELGRRVNSAFYMWVRAAKDPSDTSFKLTVGDNGNYAEINVDAEGAGYDLRLDDSDGVIKLDFVPKAANQGATGLWFPGHRTDPGGTSYNVVKDWIRPLAGQEYLRITKK